MTKRFLNLTCLFAIILFILGINIQKGFTQSQTPTMKVKGLVLESGSGMPLKQVLVSVSSTGVSAETNDKGGFIIDVPNKQAELIINLPGYNTRKVFILGRDSINISLVSSEFRSLDNYYNSPIGVPTLKDATYAVSVLNTSDIDMSRSTTFDQDIQGKVPGLQIIEQSGMPGNKTWMNIRGISSIYGKNQPLLFIDGMIHDYDYTNLSLMEGFSLNPMDIVDIEDISDITVLKNGDSYLGGVSSNGVVNINTEQKSEASTIINVSAYTGLTLIPQSQDVMNASEYKNYLSELGFPLNQINSFKYQNSTDWQKEIFKAGTMQKFHVFLKGGDDIATYNISTGYVKQNGINENTNFSRFNLRINGKVNVTDKFSVAPNAKLSLVDSYLPNQGYSSFKNPFLSALTKPPIMAINSRDPLTGAQLPFLDDVGDIFNVSNPVAIVNNTVGSNRDYNFLSSINVQYKFNSHLLISSLTGIDFNNSRESIFIPKLGLVKVDSAYNSPGDLSSEYRSLQNHTSINYTNQSASGHSFDASAGLRYMENTYKNVKSIDLNTPSDYFKNLGASDGNSLNYLRSSTGDDRGLLWLSYFGAVNYNYMSKYYVNTNLSYDANSSTAKGERYNLYPSVGVAWRISSESFLSEVVWLEDLKLRASWSQSGNIFSDIYDYSKLYYTEYRLTNQGIVTREAIPNENLEIEKKNIVNVGFDISLFKQLTNLHVDYYKTNVDNLVINQQLSDSYGYTNYFDNGGKLENSGIEIAADQRFQFGQFIWTVGASIAKQTNEIKSLKFINPGQKNIVTTVEGAEYVTSVDNVMNAFYGYKTNGIYNDASEAASITGPKNIPMQVGDIRYVDFNNDGKIDLNDKVIIGNPNPDFFGGFSTSFSFKGFELAAYFSYCMGNDAFNYVKYKEESMDSYNNQSKNVLQRWTPNNTGASIPRASIGDPTGNTLFSDRWIEDASFIRLKQLTLNYTLPNTRFYKGLTLFVTGSNLMTITKYSGYDPEFMYMNNPFSMGIDYGSIPQTMSFIIGLKLGL
jgi:TonB-linked SusC/RagA family outer membrane protein